MKLEASALLYTKLEAFRRFAKGKSFVSCRLVHYVGANKPNAVDVPLGEVEGQISGCLAEELQVDWQQFDNRLFLVAQEPGCAIPHWAKVVAEEAMVDVDEILRRAGLSDS